MGRELKMWISQTHAAAFGALFLLSFPSVHATSAGSVMFSRGPVSAERTPPVALVKGDEILVEDTVATGEAGRAQLLMLDNARIAVRPNSRLRIEEYLYGQPAASSQPVATSSQERSAISLLKGGFRTITGAIADGDETNYEVRTAVGVLGIRGTEYTAVFCLADCDWAPGVSPNAPLEDGLYLGVTDGVIFFRNENGDIELSAGEYAFIPLSDRTLRRLADPPAVLFEPTDLDVDVDVVADAAADAVRQALGFDPAIGSRREPDRPTPDDDGSAPDDDGGRRDDVPAIGVFALDADGQPTDLTQGSVQRGPRTVSFSTGPLDPFGALDNTFSGAQDNTASEYTTDNANNLEAFDAPYPTRGATVPASYAIGTASNVETGFDSLTVLRWGRWSGGTVEITLSGPADASQDFGSQSLHWVSGPENGVPVMPMTGTANYTLIGATSPTDQLGNVGVLGDASFTADFTNNVVVSDLSITIAGSIWNAAGTGTIGAQAGLPAHLFAGMYGNVSVDGIGGGTGVFSGFFSEPGPTSDPAVPGGAALTYSLNDAGQQEQVSGAAAFGNP